MRKTVSVLLGMMVMALFVVSCDNRRAHEQSGESENFNSIYHWKTVFAPNHAEMAFLKKHDIKRIYLKMFDVVVENNHVMGTTEIVPVATTKFQAPIPKDVEVVPVTYVTLNALRAMQGREREFAALIIERMLAMCSYNDCGVIREVQIDCDWTATTKDSYSLFCQVAKDALAAEDLDLSITVRLHQLHETPPPADRGVLMLYNTGALKDLDTKNSILDIHDAQPYIKEGRYPIPLDYAYPAFGWGIKFADQEFVSIVSEHERPSEGESIRVERPTAAEVMAVKQLVEEKLGKSSRGNILYHLDESQLKHYTHDQISSILAY